MDNKVSVSGNPVWVDIEQLGFFQVDGDRLQEMTQWMARPKRGEIEVDYNNRG